MSLSASMFSICCARHHQSKTCFVYITYFLYIRPHLIFSQTAVIPNECEKASGETLFQGSHQTVNLPAAVLIHDGIHFWFVQPWHFSLLDAKTFFCFRLQLQLLSNQDGSSLGPFYGLFRTARCGPSFLSLPPCRTACNETAYPFPRVGHLLPFSLVQHVVILMSTAGIQVDQHGVGVLHGGQRALGYTLVNGLIDGDHSGMY